MAINDQRVDRARPPYIHQSDLNWCWAATLEAWTRVDQRWGGLKTQSQWVADTELNAKGLLDPTTKALNIQHGIPYLAKRFNLRYSATSTGQPGVGTASLSGLRDCLRQSHALAVYQVIPGQASHVVLIYSIGRNTVYYMDPNIGYREANIVDVAVQPLVMLYR
jgi:hypothetical protein